MMLTIIIIAVLIVFTFSLILISYNLYASQNKNLSSDRNAEAANSLSIALRDELTDEDAVYNSNLWKYIRWNIAYKNADDDCVDWPYYAPNKEKHTEEYAKRYFKLDRAAEVEGMPADVSVCIYWELPEGVTQYDPNGTRNGIVLHVEITCKTAGQIYKTSDIYKLNVGDVGDNTELSTAINLSKPQNSNHVIDKNEDWKWKYTTE